MSEPTYDAWKAYQRHGWTGIPLRAQSKIPAHNSWQHVGLRPDQIACRLQRGGNLGLLTGEKSHWLVDVDCDVREACAAARELLPQTEMRHGHAGNPGSHFWYIAAGAKTKDFEFTEDEAHPNRKDILIELRASGRQTVVPPSIHPDGDAYTWECQGEPASVDADELRSAVGRVAACALLARHWPGQGNRDKAAMALAGMLMHNGWEVDDAEGFVTLTARLAGDEEWQSTRSGKAAQAAKKVQAGQSVTGAPTLAKTLRNGPRVVDKVREWLELKRLSEETSLKQSAEQPVMPSTPRDALPGNKDSCYSSRYADWPDPMDEAAYIGPIGRFVKKLAPQTEAAKEALLIQALVMAGNAMGRHAHVTVEADHHHTNLYAVVVGGTGARKGVALGQVRRLMKHTDGAWVNEHIVNGLSTGEGLINAVRDEEPSIPDKVALAVETEFASVFKVKGRDGNTLSTILRQAWDGSDLRALTRQSPLKATGTHISIIGHITPDELRRLMSETDANNGFANRILWVCAKRANYLPDGGEEVNVTDEVTALGEAIDFAKGRGRMKRDEAAKKLWHRRYLALTTGHPGLLGAVTNRAEAQVTRLSLLYALLDCSSDIQEKHLRAALAVWEYSLASARFIFGAALGDVFTEKLYEVLQTHATAGMMKTEMYQTFGNNATAERIDQALGILASQGLAERRRTPGPGGRKTDHWYARAYEFNEDKTGDVSQNSLSSLNSYPNAENAPVCMVCRQPKRARPDGGYELTCECGKPVAS